MTISYAHEKSSATSFQRRSYSGICFPCSLFTFLLAHFLLVQETRIYSSHQPRIPRRVTQLKLSSQRYKGYSVISKNVHESTQPPPAPVPFSFLCTKAYESKWQSFHYLWVFPHVIRILISQSSNMNEIPPQTRKFSASNLSDSTQRNDGGYRVSRFSLLLCLQFTVSSCV